MYQRSSFIRARTQLIEVNCHRYARHSRQSYESLAVMRAQESDDKRTVITGKSFILFGLMDGLKYLRVERCADQGRIRAQARDRVYASWGLELDWLICKCSLQ